MRKLLRADLFCLRRSRVLWLCVAAAFVISAIFLLRLSTDNENMRIPVSYTHLTLPTN